MTEATISDRTEPMRRPLLGIVFCYLAGTCAGVWLTGLHFPAGFILAVLALILAFIPHACGKYSRVRSAIFPVLANTFVFLAVFFTGWLAVDLRLRSPSARDLSALMDRPREGIEIIGVIADDPALRKNWREDRQYWSFGMQVEAVSRVGMLQKARGEVQVRTPTNAVPHYGERWHLRGVLIDNCRLPDLPRIEAKKQFIPHRFLFYVDAQSDPVRLTRASRWSLLHWCFLIREKCSVALTRGIEHRPDEIAILQALVLGRQHELPFVLREAFVTTGTYHVFAISGQHVAIIALFIVVVLQIYGVYRLNWFYYLAPVLIVFTIMTGMSASAVRGCIMAMMCFLGPLVKRKTDISSAMALAALLIVGADPLQLFQAGFLLSFGVVAGLIVLCPPLIGMSERRLAPDPYRLEPENWPARSMRRMLRWILFMMSASFAAWLVSTPLIARWFNLVSPVALPANLLVIPMATLVLLTGCLSIIFGWFCPLVSEAFNFANVFLVALMAGLTKALAQVPFGHIFVRSPPVWFVCLWLFTLLVWRIYYQKTKIWLGAVLVLLIAGVLMWRSQRNDWEIHVVNVGNRAVCFVNSAEGPVLINTGPKYQARHVLKYLRRLGVNRLQALIVPVPDSEHSGGASNIAGVVPVKEIILGGARPKSKMTRELLLLADKQKINIKEIKTEEYDTPLSCFRDFSIHFSRDAAGPACPSRRSESAREAHALPMVISIIGRARASRSAVLGRATPSLPGVLRGAPGRLDLNQPQFEIIIEEETSGLAKPDLLAVSTQAVCRVVCRPLAEEREWPRRVLPEGLPAAHRIVLGPGQGVLFLPGKEKPEFVAVNLD